MAATKPLTIGQILCYSVASMGANLVYHFANLGFPLFLKAYSVSNLLVGLLAQERSLIGGFVQPVIGVVSDRLPPNRLGRRRPFFVIGAPLTALALALLAFHPPLWAVIAIMTVLSFFLAVAYDPYLALLPEVAPPEQRGLVGGGMGVFNLLAAVTVVALSFLFWEKQQALVFWLVGCGVVIAFAFTFLTVAESPLSRAPARQRKRVHPWSYLKDIGARRELVKYLGVTFLFWLGNGGVTPFVTRFGVEVLRVEENSTFLLIIPAALGAAVFALPAGLLAKTLGKKPVLAVGLCLFGMVGLGACLVQGVVDAIVIMAVVGVANAFTVTLLVPLLADMIPSDRAGEFMGIGSAAQSLAQPIGAAMAGAVADTTGTIRGAFVAAGVAMLASFALLLFVHPEKAIVEAVPAPDDLRESSPDPVIGPGAPAQARRER
ncbi:MAG: MFS transporter [Chloroflexi bacterium]|nr:MFS transporter [Chloroflexota bacterium]